MKNKFLKTFAALVVSTTFSAAQSACESAQLITVGTYTVDTIVGQVNNSVNCTANFSASAMHHGEWFRYIPEQNYTLVITTSLPQNSGKDTRFSVFKGTCDNLVCYSGDDDSGDGYLSYKDIPVYAGEEYYIQFDDRWSAVGFDFQLIENPFIEPVVNPIEFTAVTNNKVTGTYRIAITDMNGDYLDDIITVSENQLKVVYQQTDGSYQDSTYNVEIAHLPVWSMAIGDIDKNGFNDIVMGDYQGVTFLMANNTGTGYSSISGPEYVFTQRTNFIDLNNDGHLDAFVCHDVDPNVYYINDGQGNLVFHQGSIGDHSEGGNYGSIWVDYDNDGDADLFIAKCRGGNSTAKFNQLFRNNGDGTFTDVSEAANMYDPIQTWSSAWNDFDNDGFMDALVGANALSDGSHKLMHNNGDGTFEDITVGSNWEHFQLGAVEFLSYDFDNDGWADVIGLNNRILFNNGDLSFSPVSYNFSVAAIGDLNNDGFLDVLNGTTMYMNQGNDNNWIKVYTKGIASNINGIGARVELYSGGQKQIRDVRSGQGFKYMQTLNTHFGIGQNASIDSLVIKWPSGEKDVVLNPAINSSVLVIEGTTSLSLLEMNGKKVTLYPNPTTDVLIINDLDVKEVKTMRIISTTGQVVQTLTTFTINEIDVHNLMEGMYIIELELQSGKRFAEQFIKK